MQHFWGNTWVDFSEAPEGLGAEQLHTGTETSLCHYGHASAVQGAALVSVWRFATGTVGCSKTVKSPLTQHRCAAKNRPAPGFLFLTRYWWACTSYWVVILLPLWHLVFSFSFCKMAYADEMVFLGSCITLIAVLSSMEFLPKHAFFWLQNALLCRGTVFGSSIQIGCVHS